jgi:quercetin dioxygenase-like cupin family protein
MTYRAMRPDDLAWITRPHEPGEPARHVAEMIDLEPFAYMRASLWRYDPGAAGRRHRHPLQEETFVVVEGTLSLYVGDPPVREDIPRGGAIRVDPGTPLQAANHQDEDLVLYVYGTPPETEHAEILESVVSSAAA